MIEQNDIIDNFFLEHPTPKKTARPKKSIASKLNSTRSTPQLSKQNRKDRSVKFSPDQSSNILKFDKPERTNARVDLIPKSVKQEEYISLLLNDKVSVVVATGPAGTGKSMLAVLAALKEFKAGNIDKIIISRPAVAADDEKHGFLPGDLTEKLLPWVAPILDIMKEYYSPEEIRKLIADEKIELAPVAFLRGRTFKNAFVIVDEIQNSTVNSMKMILTRIGDGSKMVLTGDLNQHDRQYAKDNGLKDFLQKLHESKSEIIKSVVFNGNDVQRHPVVKEVLAMYKEI